MSKLSHYIISSFFKPSFWKDLLSENELLKKDALKKFTDLKGYYPQIKRKRLGKWLEKAYAIHTKEYPTASIFKNAIIKNYWLHTYGFSDAVVLDEFRVGTSIADILFLNGHSECLEIKSPLDTPKRLKGQVNDYKKFGDYSSLVVHYSEVDKYHTITKSEGLGLFYIDENGVIIQNKVSEQSEYKDLRTMLQSLRKDEYLQLTQNVCGDIPKVGPIQLFKTCINWLSEHELHLIQMEITNILKSRFSHSTSLLSKTSIPDYLYYPIVALGLTNEDKNKIDALLKMEI